MMFSLYMVVLKSGCADADIDRTMASFINNNQFEYTLILGTIEDIGNGSRTSHYGYIYDNEWLDEGLAKALPIFLNVPLWDVLVIFKKVKINNEDKFFEAPRIFRSNVKMQEGTLLPEKDPARIHERVLDGWILEDDRLSPIPS